MKQEEGVLWHEHMTSHTQTQTHRHRHTHTQTHRHTGTDTQTDTRRVSSHPSPSLSVAPAACTGRELHGAGAKLRVDKIAVCHNGDGPACERVPEGAVVQMRVPRVVWMDGDSDVTSHRLWSRRADHKAARSSSVAAGGVSWWEVKVIHASNLEGLVVSWHAYLRLAFHRHVVDLCNAGGSMCCGLVSQAKER